MTIIIIKKTLYDDGAVISDCFLNEQNTQSQSTLAGAALIDALHAIKQLPVLIWSLCADKLQSDLQNRMQITLLRKPEENLPHIFTWLSNIKKEENYQNDTFPIFQLIYASKAIDAFTENDLMDESLAKLMCFNSVCWD